MKVIINPDTVKCNTCGCTFSIEEKDVQTEIKDGVYVTVPTNQQGIKFVYCPICHTKILLNN